MRLTSQLCSDSLFLKISLFSDCFHRFPKVLFFGGDKDGPRGEDQLFVHQLSNLLNLLNLLNRGDKDGPRGEDQLFVHQLSNLLNLLNLLNRGDKDGPRGEDQLLVHHLRSKEE